MLAFVCNALPARVVFGSGTIANLKSEIAAFGRTLPAIVADPHDRGARLEALYENLAVRHAPRVGRHGPPS
jgi:hypothetical protein